MISFDCHAHVYETVTPVGAVRYVPSRPAPLEDWLCNQARHRIVGGVIVQVSFLGHDNSQLLGALADLDRQRFAGVAAVGTDADDSTLRSLVEGGVRGVRWNLVAGTPIPDLGARGVCRFLDRIKAHGLHLEVQLESPRLAPMLTDLAHAAGTLVIDHMGLPVTERPEDEPWLTALAALRHRDGVHVKLSAPYRSKIDPRPHLDRLMRLLPPDRFVWGSDWPHTRHEMQASYLTLRPELADRVDDAAAAQRLYGLSGCGKRVARRLAP